MYLPSNTRVYLAIGYTDMRKSINGLSILVESQLELNPFSGHLFVFCNRKRNIIKVLYWDRNGFCIWQKRLEKEYFRWPESHKDILELQARELQWLLDGLEMSSMNGHKTLEYTSVF